jgi:hypothetical protein
MYSLYQARLSEARGMDALEGYPEQIQADTFTNARF